MSDIIAQPLVKPRELNQGGTGTSATTFSSDGTIPVVLRLPSSGQLAEAGKRTTGHFKVEAWGRVTGGTTTNFTIALYYGTSLTVGDNTAIETSGAVAVDSISTNWSIWVECRWDTTSNEINGFGSGQVDTTTTAVAALTATVTSADPDGNTAQGFVLAGTFSGGHASNVAVLDGFVLRALQ